MALGATLYRINIDLSHVDANIYAQFELRIAQHPSEDAARVVTRVLAQCLLYDERLSAGRGLGEADDPALFIRDEMGTLLHWVDVGHPGAERIHRASKAARHVSIVCHKSPEALVREREKRAIYNCESIDVWLIDPELVRALGAGLERSNEWTVVLTGGDLMVTAGDETLTGGVEQTTLAVLAS